MELVIYDMKRQSKLFFEEEEAKTNKGKAKKGNHFEIFVEYNVAPHISSLENFLQCKISLVHVVAFPGFLDHSQEAILQQMQVCSHFPSY